MIQHDAPQLRREVMHALAKVTVCETRTPDHPCPSFDSFFCCSFDHLP
jgi:hypothetical protein